MEMTQQDKTKLIHFLNFVCSLEASKPVEEMNGELIDACVTVLLDLQDKHAELSSEYIDNQVRKIFHPEDAETTEPETVKEPKKVVSKKKIWLVAACIAILVALLSIVSFSSERTVVDILEDFLGTYEFIPFGKEVDVGEETYGKNGKTVQYATITDMIRNERIDILYPNCNEEKLKTERIFVFDKKEHKHVTFEFVETSISMNIILDSTITKDIQEICSETLSINNTNYYLCLMSDIPQIQAYFTHNNNLYTVTCSDKDVLIDILENMEEVRYED